MELCAVRDCTTVSHDRLSRAPDPRAEMAQGRRNFAFEQISAKVRASSHHLPRLGRTGALRKAPCGSAEKLMVIPPNPYSTSLRARALSASMLSAAMKPSRGRDPRRGGPGPRMANGRGTKAESARVQGLIM